MGKKKKLTVEDILTSIDVKPEVIEVPQWGGTVTIKPFTKKEQQELRGECMADGEVDTERLEMALFIAGVIEPKFTEEQTEDLRKKSAAAIDLVLKRITATAGLAEDEAKEAGAFFRNKT